jgi:toxin ParE1/3/4
MASYRLTHKAEDDLDRLYERGIGDYGLRQADVFYDGLIARFEHIAQTPLLYPAVDFIRSGYRRSVYERLSIYYRVDDQNVVISRLIEKQLPILDDELSDTDSD